MALSDFLPQGTQLKGISSFLPNAKKKIDTTSSDGLYRLAQQYGLQGEADRILAEKGEKAKSFLSGGFVSDIFDVLNTLQYGVVGLIKGKSFKEGVLTRESFSDKDALGDFGIPGTIAGIALDIAVDPLTYISPWTIAKKIPAISKLSKFAKAKIFGKLTPTAIKTAEGLKTINKLEDGTRIGNWLGKSFVNRFGQDPIYKVLDQRRIKNIAVGTRNLAEMAKGVGEIPQDLAKKLITRDKSGRFIRTPLSKLKGILSDDDLFKASRAYAVQDGLSRQASKLIPSLSKETVENNIGKYIKNAYEEYERKTGEKFFKASRRGIRGVKKRVKELTPQKMKELGQIDNPAYLLFKGTFDLAKDIENAKLFSQTAKKLAVDTAQEGFQQLPKVQRLGELAGKYVPKPIFDSIQEMVRQKGTAEKVTNKVLAGFKFGKVVMNPATQARNIVSNTLLNWWKLGIGPWRLDDYAGAVKSLTKKDKYFKRALEQAGDFHTYAREELMNMLLGPEGMSAGKKFGRGWKKVVSKFSETYQSEEVIAKLAAFKHLLKKGLSDEKAWKMAEAATFNYAEVPLMIRKLRSSIWGFPFITFTYKATPLAAETILKHPQRVSSIGKIKNAIEQMADVKLTERERASEPAWIRNGFYIKLPIKDKYGRSSYLDLSYILPFGDLISGDFMEPQVSRETGIQEGPTTALSRKSPFINLVRELTSNQDFYGNKIFRQSDATEKQLGDVFRHIVKTYSPPLLSDQIPGGYDTKGNRRPTTIRRALSASDKNQRRTLTQELLRNVGLKVQPIDVNIQENFMEWEKKKALETLLKEKGPLKEFSRSYIPKD